MKKKIAIILIIVLACGGYMWLCRDISMSEIFETIDVDYDACVEKADRVEIIVPSEAIGAKIEKYKDKDKIVEIITDAHELEKFFNECSKAKGSVAGNKGTSFEYDYAGQYAVFVYDDSDLLFEFYIMGDWLAPGKPNETHTYRLANYDLDNFICENYDEEPYTGMES